MNSNLTEFNTGGSHMQNPLGGIPIGTNPQTGAPITVEEGETKTKIGKDEYVFSNNFKLTKKLADFYKLPEKLVGLSMSEASRKLSEIYKDREDGISSNTLNQFLARLQSAQEELREEKAAAINEAMAINANDMSDIGQGQPPIPMDMLGGTGMMPQEMMTQQQMADGGVASPGFLGMTKGANPSANATTGVSNAVGAASGIMGLVDQASGNTSPDTGMSVLGGAASGAAVGTMIFPGIGTAIGAGVGAIAGAVGSSAARKKMNKATTRAANIATSQYQDQMYDGGVIPNNTILNNNQYGGYGNNRRKANDRLIGFPTLGGQFVNPFGSNTVSNLVNEEIPHYTQQNPIINAQNFLIGQGYKLRGGADGKFGDSSLAALNDWRKKSNLPPTKSITPDDYLAMGFNNGGYEPYAHELDEIVVESTRPTTTPEESKPNVATGGEPMTNEDKKKFKFGDINANNILRYAPVFGNAVQLSQLQEPRMGNLHQDTTRANRRYVDEEALLRNVNNQAATTNRAIQQSGMSEGARRNMMLAASLNNQQAIGGAYLQAEDINRNIDNQADQIDMAIREGNRSRRMMAEENYARDLGMYNTQKSALRAQLYNNIGDIGLENTRARRIANTYGYDIDGNYIVDKNTGSRYNEAQLLSTIENLRGQMATAKTETDKKYLEARMQQMQQLLKSLNTATEIKAFN